MCADVIGKRVREWGHGREKWAHRTYRRQRRRPGRRRGQQRAVLAPAEAAPADVAELRAQLDELRALIDSPEGAAKLDELEEALSGDEADVATVEHVDGWFRRKLPKFSAAVHRVVVGPIVAKLVEAGGDELVAEFTRRFGGP
ncbi:hypothetical protein [Saccharothrix sp. ALI-22-I]|uniref:hypothetical protein n=1 Tax=Saccharothrix sp. ALI-22-I TaxID=1933778 RepID=UPI00117B2672|nr:hypothetical protein [Saccharothrix sp. ALI-22-I]